METRIFPINTKGSDSVNHPSHYTYGKVECIDAIETATTNLVGQESFLTGQVIKYMWRWKHKNGVEDLKKARWYLDRLIQQEDPADKIESKFAYHVE